MDRNDPIFQPLLPIPPAVPPYDAPQSQVQTFLTDYFNTQFDTLPESAPLALAQKFSVNGHGLYQASEDLLRGIYDANGGPLFYYIQDSKYGRYHNVWHYAPMVGYLVTIICAFFLAMAYLKGQTNWAMIGTGGLIDLVLVLAHSFCSREKFVMDPEVPVWLKARIWGSPTKERYALWKGSWFR